MPLSPHRDRCFHFYIPQEISRCFGDHAVDEHGFLKSIFEAFDRHRVPVDVVSTSEVSVSLTIDSNEAIPALAADLAKMADVKYE